MAENLGDKQWYVVNSYSGQEKTVADYLLKRRDSWLLQDYIFRVIVAEYTEPVIKDGKPTGKVKTKNLYPGYVFIEMIMTDDAWFMVRNTPGVTGFVGSSGGGTKPFPIPREEIEPVLKRMNIEDEDMYSDYQIGDLVRVLTGSFENAEGKIDIIDPANGEVTINIMFFGRPTPITVKFSEIEKI